MDEASEMRLVESDSNSSFRNGSSRGGLLLDYENPFKKKQLLLTSREEKLGKAVDTPSLMNTSSEFVEDSQLSIKQRTNTRSKSRNNEARQRS